LFCWCLVALNVRHLKLTLDRPWDVNTIQKLLSSLRNVLQITKHFKGFGSRFTKLHATLDADTLLYFAIHHSQNKTRIWKSTRVKAVLFHRAVARGRLMQ
jgi:hypothetical protein